MSDNNILKKKIIKYYISNNIIPNHKQILILFQQHQIIFSVKELFYIYLIIKTKLFLLNKPEPSLSITKKLLIYLEQQKKREKIENEKYKQKPIFQKEYKKMAFLYFFFKRKNAIIHIADPYNKRIHKQFSTQSMKKLEIRKNTYYNMSILIKNVIRYLKENKYRYISIFVKGRLGRKFVLRKLKKNQFIFLLRKDLTNLAFNGCRLSARKRK